MVMAHPHYLLFCDTHNSTNSHGEITFSESSSGRWHFVLEQLDGHVRFEAADTEPSTNRERLALLSVVRGLEAIEQPSKVTLVTTSRYVSRGLRYGLNTWRESDYKWERFGVQIPIRNADLWLRIDRALNFHGVTCRLIQSAASDVSAPATAPNGRVAAASAAVEAGGEFVAARNAPQSGARGTQSPLILQEVCWKLAAFWVKWWRGRLQPRPVFYGT